MEPIPTRAVAGLVAVPQGDSPRAQSGGACPQQVLYNGTLYNDSRSSKGYYDVWSLSDAELTPIGHATGKSPSGPPFVDDTVYAIDGVDPADAVAMLAASPGPQIVVLYVAIRDVPEAVCPYFRSLPTDTTICRSLRVSPTPA